MNKAVTFYRFTAATVGLILVTAGISAASQEKYSISIGAGFALPSNGTGWATENLEPGIAASLDFGFRGGRPYGFYLNARYLDHSVDTSGTTVEDQDVKTVAYGAGLGIRYWLQDKEKYDVIAGVGAGYYSSELIADSGVEDRSGGAGIDVNIGTSMKVGDSVFVGAGADYLMLFMEEGASFDDLSLTAGVGFRF